MRAEELDNLTEDQLQQRANGCFIQAENTNFHLSGGGYERLRLHLEAQFYMTAVARKRDERTARRDFRLEIAVIALISVEIILSFVFGLLALSEGRQQANILNKLNASMSATSDSLQRLVAAQDASLKILQQQQAELAKKPRFALYLGNLPIDKGALYLPEVAAGQSQAMANFNLGLKNEGDVPASPSEIHVLVPEGVYFALTGMPVPELEPSKPATRTFTYAVPFLPAGKTLRMNGSVGASKGHAPFKATFTVTTPQLKTVTPLGSLAVLPPKP